MSVTSNYTGSLATPYISKAILGAPTLDGQRVKIMPNVKFKQNIGKRSLADFDLKKYGAKFSGSTGFTYSEFTVEPFSFTVHLEEEKRLLIQTYEAEKMTPGQQNTDITFSDWIVERMGKMVSKKIEIAMWQAEATTGATQLMNAIDGFHTILVNASDSVKITGTTITEANVKAEMGKVYRALHTLEIDPETSSIYVGRAVAALWKEAVGNQNSKDWSQDQPLNYLGMPLTVSHAIPDGSIIAGQMDNFHFATDLTSDYNQVRVVDMSETTQDDLITYRLDGSADTKIAYPSECVIRYIPA